MRRRLGGERWVSQGLNPSYALLGCTNLVGRRRGAHATGRAPLQALQRRGHQLRLTALRFGGLEVELDLDAVGIDQEQLVEALVVDAALLEVDALLLEVIDQLEEAGGAERDMVDDARTVGRG